MKVPARSAAAMSISPLRAVAGRPSRVKGTDSTGSAWARSARSAATFSRVVLPADDAGCSVIGAALILDVDQELVTEHLDGRGDGRGDGGTQHADGGLLRRPSQAGGDVVTGVEEQIEVLLTAAT